MDPASMSAAVEVVTPTGETFSIALPAAVAAAVIVAQRLAEIGAKVIPDSAKGRLGVLRRILKVVAGYTVNRP